MKLAIISQQIDGVTYRRVCTGPTRLGDVDGLAEAHLVEPWA